MGRKSLAAPIRRPLPEAVRPPLPRPPVPAALVAIVLGVILTGCGSSSHHKAHSDTTAATSSPATTTATTHHTSTHADAAKHQQQSAKSASNPTSHGSGPSAAPSPPPGGLRATGGYDMYELCSGHCTGSVPAALERPLHVPALPAGGGCPTSSPKGPVRPGSSPNLKVTPFVGSAWEGGEVTWQSAASYQGPVLIRGRQVGGSSPVGFGEGHVPYDQLQLLDPAHGMPHGPVRKWPSFTRVHRPGCYAYQVDGTNFSDVIVFRAT